MMRENGEVEDDECARCEDTRGSEASIALETAGGSKGLHAHFDCFSGAAGDMLLASCLDASPDPMALLEEVKHAIRHGMPEIREEFDVSLDRVWRGGLGSISALKVHVFSIYGHRPAPVPVHSRHGHGHDLSEAFSDTNNTHDHHHGSHSSHSQEHAHNEKNTEQPHAAHQHDHAHHHHRHQGPLRDLPQITHLLQSSSPLHIPPTVRKLAIRAFTELAIAESYTHGTNSPESVHFHEVGAIDSIIDTLGTLLALHFLNVTSVSCSALPMGEGIVWTDHGQLPVPALATMRLLIGMKTCPGPDGITGELVTPTAAALLRVLTGVAGTNNHIQNSGRAPNFTPRAVGIGAGTKDFVKHPNIVRVILGNDVTVDDRIKATGSKTATKSGFLLPHLARNDKAIAPVLTLEQSEETGAGLPAAEDEISSSDVVTAYNDTNLWRTDRLTHLEANIDDATPEVLSYTMDLLLNNGAVDAWIAPIVMKKGRSAHTLHCLCLSDLGGKDDGHCLTNQLLEIIFRQTTTFGIRIQRNVERASLGRQIVQVQIPGLRNEQHTLDVKVGMLGKDIVSVKAEFDHCKAVSEQTGQPLKVIADRAVKMAWDQLLHKKY